MRNRETRKSRGVAFVNYVRVEDAEACVQATDNVEVRDSGKVTIKFANVGFLIHSRCSGGRLKQV